MKKDINQLFKDALDGHKSPYNPNVWNNIKGKIPTSGVASFGTWLIGVFSILVLTGIVFLTTTTFKSNKKHQNNRQATTRHDVNESNHQNNHRKESKNTVVVDDVKNNEKSTNQNHLKRNVAHKNTAPRTVNNYNSSSNDVSQYQVVVESEQSLNKKNSPQEQIEENGEFIAPNITCSTTQICANSTVTLLAENVQPNYKLLWVSTPGVLGESERLDIKLSATSTIQAIVVDEFGKRHNVASFTIRVQEVKLPAITVKEDKKHTKPHYALSLNDANYETVMWNLAYKNVKGKSFDFYLTKQGNYEVNITLTSRLGCTKKITQDVHLDKDYNLFAENAFTPTAAINNTFIPKALLARKVDFKMKIMNRAGEVLYQTTDASQPWKGNLSNGEVAPQGNYLWVVTLINEEGLPEKYAGDLLLMR